MFTGTYENSIDGKNRMIVPAKYRNQLGGTCMLAAGFDKCLYIYSMEDWEILVEKISKLRQTDRDVRRFIRQFFSNAEECNLVPRAGSIFHRILFGMQGSTRI